MPSLEPEQIKLMKEQLDGLGPVVKKTLDEWLELRDVNMSYPQVLAVIGNALESDNFDHVYSMIEAFNEGGCNHMRDQVYGLALIFFMLGRNVEQARIPVTPTFL